MLLSSDGEARSWKKTLATGLYDVSSPNAWGLGAGGAGAGGMRYGCSAADIRGEGNDCRLVAEALLGDRGEATDEGRDGNNCDSLSEAPDVFLRASGGRA